MDTSSGKTGESSALQRVVSTPLRMMLLTIVSINLSCARLPSPHTFSRNFMTRNVPVDSPESNGSKPKYDEITNGGKLFDLYCGSCHNARALGERPFNNYEVAFAHMRRHAYLTGGEYRQLIHFLRRWHDVGPATPEIEDTPKRFYYSQPIKELRPDNWKQETN